MNTFASRAFTEETLRVHGHYCSSRIDTPTGKEERKSHVDELCIFDHVEEPSYLIVVSCKQKTFKY